MYTHVSFTLAPHPTLICALILLSRNHLLATDAPYLLTIVAILTDGMFRPTTSNTGCSTTSIVRTLDELAAVVDSCHNGFSPERSIAVMTGDSHHAAITCAPLPVSLSLSVGQEVVAKFVLRIQKQNLLHTGCGRFATTFGRKLAALVGRLEKDVPHARPANVTLAAAVRVYPATPRPQRGSADHASD